MNANPLLKGTLQTVILKLLEDNTEMYGYEITQKVKAVTAGEIILTEGALYPALHKLEAEGFLETFVRVVDNLARAVSDFQTNFTEPVKTVITGAGNRPGCISCQDFKKMLGNSAQPFMLLLGTGWGLTEECFEASDYILEPIAGAGTYNHLSVRSAAAIMLDRLIGMQ